MVAESLANPPHYRPELDGLRAVAVAAVLLFHLDPSWLPGGFAGVDVFFVLSGYLVTTILLRGGQPGGPGLLTFYQRRIARIFPAFLTLSLATLTAAGFCYSSWDFASAGAACSAALLSTANFHLLGQGDYFQLSRDAQPFLHTWSLSVEEQFYLVFPFGFALLPKARLRRTLLWILTLLSFGVCLFLTAAKPVHAFYLLPSRAWEMLAGSLAALHAAPRLSMGGSAAQRLPAALGSVAILTSFFILTEGPHFPGWQALLPVLGTVAVIRHGAEGPLRRLLSAGPLPLIGRLSYSLYLWHWPVFSMVDYTLPFQSPATRLLLKITLTGLSAGLSFRLIEQPARAWLNRPQRRWSPFVLLAAALILLVPAGYFIHRRHYLDASNGTRGVLTFPAPGANGTLILMGDSQGSMYGQLARDLAAGHRMNLILLSSAGEDPLASTGGPPAPLFTRNLEVIRREKPAILILACHWVYKLKEEPARLARTLQALQPHAGKIILLTQPPLLPESATRAAIRQGSRGPWWENPADRTLRHRLNQLVRQQATSRIAVVDTDSFLTWPDGSLMLYDAGGRALFHDPVHLSTHGADRLKAAVEACLP